MAIRDTNDEKLPISCQNFQNRKCFSILESYEFEITLVVIFHSILTAIHLSNSLGLSAHLNPVANLGPAAVHSTQPVVGYVYFPTLCWLEYLLRLI